MVQMAACVSDDGLPPPEKVQLADPVFCLLPITGGSAAALVRGGLRGAVT